jgi:hypothetical protein
MRLLPVGHDHGGAALLKAKPKPTDADIDAAMTNICRCGTFQEVRKAIHARPRPEGSDHDQNSESHRRSFIVGSAAVAAASRSACACRLRPAVVRAADGSPEINAWVVIRPDDTVVIRVARSEMGQGTITGLAQMVAEELECDWKKITTNTRRRARA